MPPRPPLPDCWALLGSCCVAGRWASWAHQRYSLARGGPFPHQRALPTPGRSTPAYFYPGCRLHSGDDALICRWKSPRHVVLRPSWTVDRGNWLGDSERSLTFPWVHQDYLWSSKWRCEKQFAGAAFWTWFVIRALAPSRQSGSHSLSSFESNPLVPDDKDLAILVNQFLSELG